MQQSNIAWFFGGALAASAFFYLTRTKDRKQESKQIDTTGQQYEALKKEQLARVVKYFGEDKFTKMEESYVMVLGVGGVGSHVVNMLARSGVKKIKIVDFDQVTLSSLNRHSCAVRANVGTSKVQCIKNFIGQILPHIEIECIQTYVTVENANSLLQGPLDYVIDCIDNLDAKVQIVRLCKQKNIRLICSGGAGMKSDPTKLQIRDISDCKYDNLIMRMKRELGKHQIKSGVKVAYSYQQAEKELLPLQEHQEQQPDNYRVFDNYRLRIVPVLGTMPAILGMAIASYVLCDLAGEPYKPFETDYVKSTAISKLYNEFLVDQRRRGVPNNDIQIDMEEVSILAKKVFKWDSAISGKKESGQRLARWDASKPATIDNLVLFNKKQYEKHIKFTSLQETDYDQETIARVAEKTAYAKKLYDSGYMMFI